MLTGTDSCPLTATGLPDPPEPPLQASASGIHVLSETLRLGLDAFCQRAQNCPKTADRTHAGQAHGHGEPPAHRDRTPRAPKPPLQASASGCPRP
jgi:hypothetical protein